MTEIKKNETPAQAQRRQRLSAALRENLKRRKAQARGRRDGQDPVSDQSRQGKAESPSQD